MGNACSNDSNVADSKAEQPKPKPAAAADTPTAASTDPPKKEAAEAAKKNEQPAKEEQKADGFTMSLTNEHGKKAEPAAGGGDGGGMLALPMEGGPKVKRNRRVSVSAEVDNYHRESSAYVAKVIPKSAEAKASIKAAMAQCFLFNGMDDVQEKKICDAMEEKKVAAGDEVISQFGDGDFFYVIDNGTFDVLKAFGPQSNPGEFKKVFNYDNKGSFGELALMYNCPRAATVKATSEGLLWAVDRATFRQIIIKETAKKRQEHENFLRAVPVFQQLSQTHISQIADALKVKTYQDKEVIVKEGDVGDAFFLVESGECIATQTPEGTTDEPVEVGRMSKGQYFGERALLTNERRAANVIAVGESQVVSFDRATFERLFTIDNCESTVTEMKSKMKTYKSAKEIKEAAP